MNFILLIVVLVVSIAATYLVKEIAIKKSIIDIPNDRSSHTIPTPHGGGIAIALVWFTILIIQYIYRIIPHNLFIALLFGAALSIVGFLDDLLDLSPRIRIITQVIVAASGLYFIGGLHKIDIGFYQFTNPYVLNFLALIGIVWFINLFNFLDGIDGYLGTETVFIFIVLYFVSGLFWLNYFVAIVIGFLVWNWPRAKIFMGDVGSTLIGYNVAILIIYFANISEVSILNFMILTSLFWFDASFTLYRRWRNKEKLSQAHRKHAFQRIVQAGWSHKKTVIGSIVINLLILGFFCLGYFYKPFIILLLGFNICFLFLINKFIDKKKPFV